MSSGCRFSSLISFATASLLCHLMSFIISENSGGFCMCALFRELCASSVFPEAIPHSQQWQRLDCCYCCCCHRHSRFYDSPPTTCSCHQPSSHCRQLCQAASAAFTSRSDDTHTHTNTNTHKQSFSISLCADNATRCARKTMRNIRSGLCTRFCTSFGKHDDDENPHTPAHKNTPAERS